LFTYDAGVPFVGVVVEGALHVQRAVVAVTEVWRRDVGVLGHGVQAMEYSSYVVTSP
jgi:hypothetical protein